MADSLKRNTTLRVLKCAPLLLACPPRQRSPFHSLSLNAIGVTGATALAELLGENHVLQHIECVLPARVRACTCPRVDVSDSCWQLVRQWHWSGGCCSFGWCPTP